MVTPTHYINNCFPIGNIGGLDSVMLRENSLSDKSVVCLSPADVDQKPGDQRHVGNITYRIIDDLTANQADRWDIWFGVGFCQLTFPEAYTKPTAGMGAIAAMFKPDIERESNFPIGTLPRLHEYVERYASDWQAARYFTKRFEKDLLSIPHGSIMNWQSFFMEPAINDYADTLRNNGVYQTFHLHEALPDSLIQTKWGIRFLRALTKVDAVYLHTDRFINRLQKQFEQAQLNGLLENNIPAILRYDLGIDLHTIDRGLSQINKHNYLTSIPNWDNLSTNQQEFIKEVFKTRDTIPHRFICVDRIDPVKGVDIVIQAIDELLLTKLQQGLSIEELKHQYRFFFLQKPGNAVRDNPYNQAGLYNDYTEKCFQNLQNKYPGIIWRADPLGGQHRPLLFPLMQDCHGITGGTTEGLNLSIQEIAYSNQNQDTSIICGQGAGFAMQVIDNNRLQLAEFPRPGNVEEFKSAMENCIAIKENHPGKLRQLKKIMIDKEILTRNDSVIVGK